MGSACPFKLEPERWKGRETGKKRGGSRDTKTDGLIEKENSTPQSNICPLFCITIH